MEMEMLLAGLAKGPYVVAPVGEPPLYAGFNKTGVKYALKQAVGTVVLTAKNFKVELPVAGAMQLAGAL